VQMRKHIVPSPLSLGNWMTNFGWEDTGKTLVDSGKDVDVGSTIYDDDHGVVSFGMWSLYFGIAPGHATYDLIVEIFE